MEIAVNYEYRESDVCNALDVEALATFVINAEEKPDDTEVSVNFVTNETIHDLNREYRGIDRPTDVLSFECDGYEDENDSPFVDGMGFELGDIVIAPDIAEKQAPEYGLTFAEELSLLITHGLLHLCGYDHMEDEEARIMESRETEILSAFWKRPFKRSAVEG